VPKTNAILFIVNEKGGAVAYHFFNMTTDDDNVIRAPSSAFGNAIGFNSNDTIDLATNGNVILNHFDRGGTSTLPELKNLDTLRWVCYLDFNRNMLLTQRTRFFDKQGKLLLDYDELKGR
jgi:hypothetical protein